MMRGIGKFPVMRGVGCGMDALFLEVEEANRIAELADRLKPTHSTIIHFLLVNTVHCQ